MSSMKTFACAPEVHGETHVPDFITRSEVHLRELMRHLGTMSSVMSSSGGSDVGVRDGEFNDARTYSGRNSSRVSFDPQRGSALRRRSAVVEEEVLDVRALHERSLMDVVTPVTPLMPESVPKSLKMRHVHEEDVVEQ